MGNQPGFQNPSPYNPYINTPSPIPPAPSFSSKPPQPSSLHKQYPPPSPSIPKPPQTSQATSYQSSSKASLPSINQNQPSFASFTIPPTTTFPSRSRSTQKPPSTSTPLQQSQPKFSSKVQQIDKIKIGIKMTRDKVDRLINQYQTQILAINSQITLEKQAGLSNKRKAVYLLKQRKDFQKQIENLELRKQVVLKTLNDLNQQHLDKEMVMVLEQSNQYMRGVQEELERMDWRGVLADVAVNQNYQNQWIVEAEEDPDVERMYREMEREVMGDKVLKSVKKLEGGRVVPQMPMPQVVTVMEAERSSIQEMRKEEPQLVENLFQSLEIRKIESLPMVGSSGLEQSVTYEIGKGEGMGMGTGMSRRKSGTRISIEMPGEQSRFYTPLGNQYQPGSIGVGMDKTIELNPKGKDREKEKRERKEREYEEMKSVIGEEKKGLPEISEIWPQNLPQNNPQSQRQSQGQQQKQNIGNNVPPQQPFKTSNVGGGQQMNNVQPQQNNPKNQQQQSGVNGNNNVLFPPPNLPKSNTHSNQNYPQTNQQNHIAQPQQQPQIPQQQQQQAPIKSSSETQSTSNQSSFQIPFIQQPQPQQPTNPPQNRPSSRNQSQQKPYPRPNSIDRIFPSQNMPIIPNLPPPNQPQQFIQPPQLSNQFSQQMNRPPLPPPASFNNNLRGSNNGNPMNQIPQQQQQQQQQFFAPNQMMGAGMNMGMGMNPMNSQGQIPQMNRQYSGTGLMPPRPQQFQQGVNFQGNFQGR